MAWMFALTAAGIAGLTLAASPARAAECSEVVLGAPPAFTGRYADDGIATRNGYEFAVAAIKKSGGIRAGDKCYNLRIIYHDSESKPERAGELVERLTGADGVRFLLGTGRWELTQAVAARAQRRQAVLLAPAGLGDVAGAARNTIFSVAPALERRLDPLLKGMQELRGRGGAPARALVLTDGSPGQRERLQGFAGAADRISIAVSEAQLTSQSAGAGLFLTRVRRERPDLLLVAAEPGIAGQAISKIAEAVLYVPLVAASDCRALKQKGVPLPSAGGMLCAADWSESLRTRGARFGSASEFAGAVRASFKEFAARPVPERLAQAAASIVVFADALQRAGSPDPAKVRAALVTTDLATFYGPVRFGPDGSNAAKPVLLKQVRGREMVIVYPSPFGSGAQ